LLNFPLRPEGTLDDESLFVVKGIGGWMAMNSEAIFATRPWKVFGEGPTQSSGGHFNEAAQPWTPEDFRFTCKGDTVYVFQMAKPASRMALVKTLKIAENLRIKEVQMLGFPGIVPWSQTEFGLQVDTSPTASSDLPGGAVTVFKVRIG
jgi:alpha-L-fucosidase